MTDTGTDAARRDLFTSTLAAALPAGEMAAMARLLPPPPVPPKADPAEGGSSEAGPHPLPPRPPPRMGRAAMAAGAANLFGRLGGLARDIVFTAVFGAGEAADAYFAAFRVPNILRELLAEGTLANVYVPLFAETTETEGLDAAWRMANAVLGLLLIVLGLVTILFVLLAKPLVYLVASGFGAVPGKVELAAWLTKLLAPFLAGLSVASLFGGMLNVRGRFFLPALAPSFLNLFIIAACLFSDRWAAWTGTPAIGAVAVAATLSGVATAGVQYPALRRLGYRFRPTFRGHPAIRRILKFVSAALVGIVVVQFNLLVETQIASRFGDGPVSFLMLGFRLVQLPQTVVSVSVATAALASLSVMLARSDRRGARRTLSQALEMNAVLVVPAAVGLYLLANPLVALFFERGAFTAADAAATAGILKMYAIATVGICTYRVLLPVFFALNDPYTPMRLSIAVMVMKVPVALFLVYTLGMGINGLPLSHAVTVTFEVTAMLWLLGSRIGHEPGFWNQNLRVLAASAGMGVVVWALLHYPGMAGTVGVLGVALAGVAVYAALAWGLRIRAAHVVFDKVKGRLLSHRPPGAAPPH